MAVSGPEAMRSLDDAVRDIRREESEIGKRLSRSAERIGKIREGEAELFRKLAEVRLSPVVQKQINGRLSNAEQEARLALKAHAAEISASEDLLKAVDGKIAALASARHETLIKLEYAQEKLKIISSQIADVIERDPAYKTQRTNADELHAIADESLKKTQVAETDQEQKGRPYRNDPLFMYLWERGYSTSNYKANNLARWLDGMVAGLIDYHRARPNFSMLNEIPLRLREHADRQIAIAEVAEGELDRIEAEAIAKAGGEPITKSLNDAQQRLEKLDLDMVKSEDERDQLVHKFAQTAEGKDPVFIEAVGNLALALGADDLGDLLDKARRTKTKKDDALVTKISDARARAFDENKENGELRERLKVLERRRRELEDIEWEFKKARFDDPRSQFRKDELVGDLLGEFLRGAITAASYWGQWQRSQSWRAGTSDWGGSVGLPRGGRRTNLPSQNAPRNSQYNNSAKGRSPWGTLPNQGGSSNGFSRPRTGSRGSRKSGGFKTGGGF